MTTERLSATETISAPADRIFAMLADPSTHAAIDGTGWVRGETADGVLSREGQIFRMSMYHPKHPDKNYQTDNRITVYEPARAIAWQTGPAVDGEEFRPGGWVWRYDLTPAGTGTRVELSYDWSAVSAEVREYLSFPPFPPEHLSNSLRHLAKLADG
jgi:uncharacterized protein YndB with AHSA1/START domain